MADAGSGGAGVAKPGAEVGSALMPIPALSALCSGTGTATAAFDWSGALLPVASVLARRLATMPTAPPPTTMTSAAVAHARVQSDIGGRVLRTGTRTG